MRKMPRKKWLGTPEGLLVDGRWVFPESRQVLAQETLVSL